MGGGASFFFLKKSGLITGTSFLSDLNEELINSYIQLQTNLLGVQKGLKLLSNDSQTYYCVRAEQSDDLTKNAVNFIYLNQTSYNGIYRVNRKGLYNVPYGRRIGNNIINHDNLVEVHKSLNDNVMISSGDFQKILSEIRKNDLVFLDPPYTVAHENNGFIEYNQSLFTWEHQERLAEFLTQIDSRGGYYILTNAKHDSIHELFSPIAQEKTVERASVIGGKGATRQTVKEYIYTNF